MQAVFVQSNESEANRVFVFRRAPDGALSEPTAVPTGGSGDGIPHLASQGSVVVTSDGRRLLVTNAGSDELSVLTIADEPALDAVIGSAGSAPKSVAEHKGLVYVLNTGDGSLAGFRLAEHGVRELDGSRRELGAEADPAQVGFAPTGDAVLVTDRGANAILVYPVQTDGSLGAPHTTESAGPTPYGFAFAAGSTLVVTEAFGAAKGMAAASSYRLGSSGAELVTGSVGNGRSEICWAAASADRRHVFTTNFADGAVSCYAVSSGGELTLDDPVAAVAVDGQPGLRDEGLSQDGRFLYAIDVVDRCVRGWGVSDGALAPLGSWNDLPPTIAGLAAN